MSSVAPDPEQNPTPFVVLAWYTTYRENPPPPGIVPRGVQLTQKLEPLQLAEK